MQNNPINVPVGTTSKVQSLDVSINKPFRNYVRELFEQHLDGNLELYVDGKLTAGERRVLTTKKGRQGMGACKETYKDNL